MPSATLPRANRPDALCRHRVVNVNFRYPAHAMATSFGCSTGLVHCHVAAHRATTQPRALQRKKLLACSSIQSSFVGTHFVHKAKVHCSRTQARSSNRLEISAEQSYIMIKPDGVQRALVGEIITRFERKGFTLKALKMFTPSKQLAEEHYKDLSSKPFFGNLVEYIISGPVIAMVWEGDGVVKSARKLIGATNPLEAEAGTIRGDFAIQTGRNVVHGSDSPENGIREAKLWFGGGDDIVSWQPSLTPWLVE